MGLASDEFAPEASLLSIQVRRPQLGMQGAASPLHSAWHAAFDPVLGAADEDVLKASLGQTWLESFVMDRTTGSPHFAIRPIGRLSRDIQEILANGETMPALMEQINHMAMVNCHSVEPASGLIELDDGYEEISMNLTLLPLASRDGVVNRYLGTLGQ